MQGDTETVVESVAREPDELALDPFGFLLGVTSRIAGLGGNVPGHDPFYAFHTPYVEVARGDAHFTLHFTALTARLGTLVLRVHMLPSEPGAVARMAGSERILLSRIIAQGGQTTIKFEGFRNVTYALYGMIADDTDARAEALVITLDRPAISGDTRGALVEAHSTTFGKGSSRSGTHLLSLDPPSLADPVSQICTQAQLREAALDAWREKLPVQEGGELSLWKQGYILQVLSRYGMLEPGARGVGFGTENTALADVIRSFGAEAVVFPWATGDDHGVTHASVDPHQAQADGAGGEVTSLPAPLYPGSPREELVNFDFAWSAALSEQMGSAAAVFGFVEQSLESLRPGGLAVHIVKFRPSPAIAPEPDAVFRPLDIERMALNLISRGHEVAQLKLQQRGTVLAGRGFAEDESLDTTLFGIIVRKALSPL